MQFRTIVRSGKSISTIFVFLESFAWLCKINFHFSLSVLQPKSILFQFACSCEIEKHGFSTPFCNLSHFFILISLQLPPNPNTNRLHCFFHYAFGSSSTLFVFFNLIHLFCYWFIKNIPWNDSKNFIKLVSNSCKGKHMLIECFRYNYYSKYVKLMRIII